MSHTYCSRKLVIPTVRASMCRESESHTDIEVERMV